MFGLLEDLTADKHFNFLRKQEDLYGETVKVLVVRKNV